MKINRQKNITNDLPIFEDLEVGATFMGRPMDGCCYDGKEIFMKLNRNDESLCLDCDLGAAIDLETGEIAIFPMTACVIEVETELNVK